jgi:hypothetical protein
MPMCIIGPLKENIYSKYNKDIKLIKTDEEAILDKSLYYSMEKISEKNNFDEGKACIIVYGAITNCVERCFNSINVTYKFAKSYDMNNIDLFLISKNSVSVVLQKGTSIIRLRKSVDKKKTGHSINLLDGEAKVSIYEKTENQKEYNLMMSNYYIFNIFRYTNGIW